MRLKFTADLKLNTSLMILGKWSAPCTASVFNFSRDIVHNKWKISDITGLELSNPRLYAALSGVSYFPSCGHLPTDGTSINCSSCNL